MAGLSLARLPADAAAILTGSSEEELDLLMIEVRRLKEDAKLAAYPADADAAVKGARKALRDGVTVTVDEPLEAFAAIFAVVREVLAKGIADDLDKIDCEHLWRVTDIADDLLRAHRAAVEEAELRLRAHTHPVPAYRK